MFLQELQCFIAVADCLNFTTAASQLYISQPGLSKTISHLESSLNVRLFNRSTRSVRLTAAGEQFLAISREFLHRCDTLTAVNPQDSLAMTGSLTIGIGDLNENRCLPQIINEFTQRFPLCSLTVKRYDPEALLEAINTGEVDFGVMISYTIPAKGYQFKVYYPSPLMLVVPASHRLASRDVVRISELKDEHFVSINRSASRAGNRIQEVCARGNVYPKFMKETNSLATMFMLVATGMGISINFLLHRDSCNYDLRFIKLDLEDGEEDQLRDGASLVWKKGNENPAVQPFIDCIDAWMSREYADTVGPHDP